MQQHRIKRQVIELNVPRAEDANAVYASISAMVEQTITPLIARCCDRICDDDALYQIEQLSIDLGEIEQSNLQQAFVEQLEPALFAALQTQIQASRQNESTKTTQRDHPTKKATDLIKEFLQSGLLPWWADHNDTTVITTAIDELLTRAPEDLRVLVSILLDNETRLTRLITHLEPTQLHQLVKQLHPQADVLSQACLQLVPWLQQTQGGDKNRWVQRIWQALLSVSCRCAIQPERMPGIRFAQLLIQAIADQCQVSHSQLVSAIKSDTTRQDVALLRESLPDTADRAGQARPVSIDALTQQVMTRWQSLKHQSPETAAHFWAPLCQTLPAMVQPATELLLKSLATDHRENKSIRHWSDTLTTLASPATVIDILQKVSHRLQLAQDKLLVTATYAKSNTASTQPNNHAAFNDAEDIAVGNAGLVLLAPFLPHFFQRLGLLEENVFIDLDAAHQGVRLLQWLATHHQPGVEYQFPLNKVLCGLPPTELIDTEIMIDESQQQESDYLLESVLGHAPMLGKLTLDGFRASFLRRNALLKTDTLSWHLYVERQSFDVVLEKLPWQFHQVRLPWMKTPLTVEWL